VVGAADGAGRALALTRSLRPDAVFIDAALPAPSGLDVARALSAERLAAVLLYYSGDPADEALITQADGAGAMAMLTEPLRPGDLGPAVALAVARFRELVHLEGELKALGEKMEARKLVGRAKAILMERSGLTEREAFHRIQSQSISLNKPVHEIAKAIITASEISA
jgi:response regulator NasT